MFLVKAISLCGLYQISMGSLLTLNCEFRRQVLREANILMVRSGIKFFEFHLTVVHNKMEDSMRVA